MSTTVHNNQDEQPPKSSNEIKVKEESNIKVEEEDEEVSEETTTVTMTTRTTDETDKSIQMASLVDSSSKPSNIASGSVMDNEDPNKSVCAQVFDRNPEFYAQALKFLFCFCGLQASYLTWGYMQELIMTTEFNETPSVPSGRFPSAQFCVFSNRFLAVIVAMIAVKLKHGAVYDNNVAPLIAFTPCAISNTMSSWSQYKSLEFVAFPVQTVFKSSKIIPVMIMGKVLKGTKYPFVQYLEAALITLGVAIFSLASKTAEKKVKTEIYGLLCLCTYITFDSFTSQWQDKVYQKYGRSNVDPYQMMLGVNTSAILITSMGLTLTHEWSVVYEFLSYNPSVLQYNIITAITSASGQLFIYYTIKEFGPIVFTIIMTTRQMISIVLSSLLFQHKIGAVAILGAVVVFSVLFSQIRRKYLANQKKKIATAVEVPSK